MSSPFLLSLAPLRSPDRQISLFRAQSLLPCGCALLWTTPSRGCGRPRGRGIRSAHHLQTAPPRATLPDQHGPSPGASAIAPWTRPSQSLLIRTLGRSPPASAQSARGLPQMLPARAARQPRLGSPPRPARTGHAQRRVTRPPARVRSEPYRVRSGPGCVARSHGAHRGGGCGPLRVLSLPAAAHAALPPGEAAPWAPSARPSRGREPRPQP